MVKKKDGIRPMHGSSARAPPCTLPEKSPPRVACPESDYCNML